MDIKHLIPNPEEDIVLRLLALMNDKTHTFEDQIVWGLFTSSIITQKTTDADTPQIGYWAEAALLSLENSLDKAREKHPNMALLGTHFDDVTFSVREQLRRAFLGQGFYGDYLCSEEEMLRQSINDNPVNKLLKFKIGVGVALKTAIPIAQPYFAVIPLTLGADKSVYDEGEPLYVYDCTE